MNGGMIQGWHSPMALLLETTKSPVGALDLDDITFLATTPFYLYILFAFLNGMIANKFGRKASLFCVGILSTIGGLILTFANTKIVLYIGRTLSGAACVGAIPMSLMYVSEIVHGSVRGTMISACTVMLSTGTLIAYIFGKVLSYRAFSCVMTGVPAIYTILLFWLPESPYFLVIQSRMKEGMKALVWFRGGNYRIAKLEFTTIKPPAIEEHLSIIQTLKTKGTRAALTISVLGYAFDASSGILIITNYGGLIFNKTGSPLNSFDSMIVIAVALALSSLTSLILVDKFGRKPLLYYSFFFGGVNLLILAIFMYFQMERYNLDEFRWIPITSVSAFVLVYGVGVANIPPILMNEVSPVSIKPLVTIFVIIVSTILRLAVLQSFAFFERIGLCYAFGIFSFINFVGLFYTWGLVPETKGKSLTEIYEELNE